MANYSTYKPVLTAKDYPSKIDNLIDAVEADMTERQTPSVPKAMNGQLITGLADPTSSQNAATMAYVQAYVAAGGPPADIDVRVFAHYRTLALFHASF